MNLFDENYEDMIMSDEIDRTQFSDSGYDHAWGDEEPLHSIGSYRLLVILYDNIYPTWVIGKIAKCVEMLTKFSNDENILNEFGKPFFVDDMVNSPDRAFPLLMKTIVRELIIRLRENGFMEEANFIRNEYVPMIFNNDKWKFDCFRSMFGIRCLDDYNGSRFNKFVRKIREDIKYLKSVDVEMRKSVAYSDIPKDLIRAWIKTNSPVTESNEPFVVFGDETIYLDWCDDICSYCKHMDVISVGGGYYEPPDYEVTCGKYAVQMQCGSCKGHGFITSKLIFEKD